MLRSIISAGFLSVLAAATPMQKRQAVGSVITSCTVGGTFALAFDDGPYIYTSGLLDTLASAGVKATFFLNGANYGSIYDYSAVVARMAAEGHQVASHTWSHADLTTLDAAGVTSQVTQLETALTSIIGKYPTYIRPPYYAYTADTLSILGGLGYTIVTSDIDTLDWSSEVNAPDVFSAGLNNGGTVTLCHDPLPETVSNLVPYIINAVKAKGLNMVTVAECIGDGNPYATSRG